MPAVFIHGVPDTIRVWDRVLQQLGRADIVTLALPGFHAPLPKNFTATKEEYVNWIIAQLENISGSVDLVGHDWGCILAVRVASLRPDLIRSWAAGSGPLNRDYQWHPLAKTWQTPAVGEEWMERNKKDDLSRLLQQNNIPPDLAAETASRMDSLMKDSILRLYRSAVNVGAEWQPELAQVSAPGLVFWGEHDPACPVSFADKLAADTKAKRTLKLNCGHWTLIEQPAEVAQAFEKHWASVQ